jgi:hypothetical protein
MFVFTWLIVMVDDPHARASFRMVVFFEIKDGKWSSCIRDRGRVAMLVAIKIPNPPVIKRGSSRGNSITHVFSSHTTLVARRISRNNGRRQKALS